MSGTEATGIAIVGCGFVADAYRECLRHHLAQLRLTGVYDREPERLSAYTKYWSDRAYQSFDELLNDDECKVVVNLTDPQSHAKVTAAAIAAGKHVYSEKPLAMTGKEAAELRFSARRAGVRLSAAPCSLLGECAQSAWTAIRSGRIGRAVLAYAELDDGMIHLTNYRDWLSRSGRTWPARSEFATGCTFEHAGYVVTLLAAMFGPVRRITGYSSLLIPDKRTEPPLPDPAPDFSVGILEFDDGIVARLTNSVIAPYDHRLRIIGEMGTIEIREPWDYASSVILQRPAEGRLQRLIERRWGWLRGTRLPPVRSTSFIRRRRAPTMDFMRGVAELADCIQTGRRSRLDEDLAVHVTEVTEILQHPERFDRPAPVWSTFAPIDPMDWAG